MEFIFLKYSLTSTIWTFSVLIFVYCLLLLGYRLWLSPLAKFPGPKLAAATGWYEVYFDVVLGGQFLWEIERMHQRYGPIIRINPFELHIKDPGYYNTLYSGSLKKRDKYPWMVLPVGLPNSTFATANHGHHLLRRGILSPYFSQRAVRRFEEVIQQKANALCKHVDEAIITGNTLELHTCSIAFAVDIVSHIGFGASGCVNLLQAQPLDDKWKKGLESTFRLLLLVRHFPTLLTFFRILPVQLSALFLPSSTYVHDTEQDIERHLRKLYEDTDHNEGRIEDIGIFSEIIHNTKIPPAERKFERLVDDAKFLLMAAAEATSNLMTTTLFYILRDEAVMGKLQCELDSVGPNPGEDIPLSVLERLPYLTAAIKEGLRITSSITSRLPRIATDESLEFQGWRIPPGIPVSMTIYQVLRDPDIFPEPLEFSPERWLGSRGPGENLEPYFVPFCKGSQG